MGQLDGKVALITGANRGVGQGVARAFAEQGATVIVASRSEKAAKAGIDAINQDYPQGRAVFIQTDVSDRDNYESTIDTVLAEFGRVDILVNSAGIASIGNVGDTTINGVVWQKINSSSDSGFTVSDKKGYTRVHGQFIMYKENIHSLQDTLCDFGLTLGDSVRYNFGGPEIRFLKVDSVKSEIINGFSHKKIIFKRENAPLCCSVKEVWIEGIGSLHGPLFPKYPVFLETESYDEGMDLTCFSQEGTSLWHNSNYKKCFNQNILSSVELETHSSWSFYTNPTEGIIKFTSNENHELKEISIFNLLGKEIIPKIIYTQHSVFIDFSGYTPGIYFVQLMDENGVSRTKVIKK